MPGLTSPPTQNVVRSHSQKLRMNHKVMFDSSVIIQSRDWMSVFLTVKRVMQREASTLHCAGNRLRAS